MATNFEPWDSLTVESCSLRKVPPSLIRQSPFYPPGLHARHRTPQQQHPPPGHVTSQGAECKDWQPPTSCWRWLWSERGGAVGVVWACPGGWRCRHWGAVWSGGRRNAWSAWLHSLTPGGGRPLIRAEHVNETLTEIWPLRMLKRHQINQLWWQWNL